MPNQHNAKYAFYYLLSLVALIFTALSVGMIAFGIIDKTVLDLINTNYGNPDGQLKFAISALLIAVPIFYIISHLIYRGLRQGEITKDSGIRRWLTYFIILVSSLIILGVFIGVINNFLAGELTGRFVWKALTVFVIAAGVFSFYFYDIRRPDPASKNLTIKLFFFISLAVALTAFIAAWFFVESPQTARARRLDQLVVNNISTLESMVNTYYDRHQALPDNLEALTAEKDLYITADLLVDPETKGPITYNKLNDRGFQFCATFRTDSLAQNGQNSMPLYSTRSIQDHAAGYQCLPGTLWSAVKSASLK